MLIEVTEDDIKHATFCPLTKALMRYFPDNVDTIQVGTEAFTIDGNDVYQHTKAIRFVEKIDEGIPVEPMSFDLDECKKGTGWETDEDEIRRNE